MNRMTIADLKKVRGFNWYGMEDGLRGPSLAELQDARNRGLRFIRLPLHYDTPNAPVQQILANAEAANIWVGVERHNYGRIGGEPKINATDGTLITTANAQVWYDKCLADLAAFGQYESYVPLDMNEPSQTAATGTPADRNWETISRGRVTAMRAAGYTGTIGVCSGARSSAGGINTIHPNGWWITDPDCFLEVHHYLGGLKDSHSQTRTELNKWTVDFGGQAGITTYLQYINRSFGFGLFGTAKWNPVPILIGEFAMPQTMILELHQYLSKVDIREAGALLWAGGMWNNYPWKMTPEQRNALAAHTEQAGIPTGTTTSPQFVVQS